MLLGVPLIRRAGNGGVAEVTSGIGAICLAGGFVGLVSLYAGGFSLLAVLAVLCAFFATRARASMQVGLGVLALGLALGAIYQLPGQASQWLATLAIIALALGAASALTGWLRASSLYAGASGSD
ncbi:MAG: hypothetical protein JO219_05545 [Candidatus Eremiobacteraeota bacterium]|nr:hypothetical protein [Candidatus Eremiobacteraeota bacterium]